MYHLFYPYPSSLVTILILKFPRKTEITQPVSCPSSETFRVFYSSIVAFLIVKMKKGVFLFVLHLMFDVIVTDRQPASHHTTVLIQTIK